MSLLPDTSVPTSASPSAVPTPVTIQPMPLPALPLPTVVSWDIHCRTCGYNLRSLSASSVCPECATPIAKSLKGNWIRHADPGWIRIIRSGLMACLAGAICSMIFAGFISGSMVIAIVGPTWAPVMSPASLAIILGYAAMLAGAWMITMPDPAGGEKRLERRRQSVRVVLVCRTLQLPFQWFIENGAASSLMPQFLILSAALGDLLGLAMIISLLRYLTLLAHRIPNAGLSRGSKWMAILLSIMGGIEIGLEIYRELFSYFTMPPPIIPFYSAWKFSSMAFFFVAIYYASLLNRWNSTLKEEAAIARAQAAMKIPAGPSRASSVPPPTPPSA